MYYHYNFLLMLTYHKNETVGRPGCTTGEKKRHTCRPYTPWDRSTAPYRDTCPHSDTGCHGDRCVDYMLLTGNQGNRVDMCTRSG